MDGTTIIEIVSLSMGGGGILGLILGFATFKYLKIKAKSEAKGAEAEADMKRQDVYQEIIDDLQKDRERMKSIREEQEGYIQELREDKHRLRKENEELRKIVNELQDTQREQGDKIARLARMYNALKPLICSNIGCKQRQGDIMGLVADDSFDVVEEANKNTKKREKKEK